MFVASSTHPSTSHPPPCPTPRGGGEVGVRAFAITGDVARNERETISSAPITRMTRDWSGRRRHCARTPSPLWGGLGRGVYPSSTAGGYELYPPPCPSPRGGRDFGEMVFAITGDVARNERETISSALTSRVTHDWSRRHGQHCASRDSRAWQADSDFGCRASKLLHRATRFAVSPPSPLVGEGGGGGVIVASSAHLSTSHPPPCPSPRGGGDVGARAFAIERFLPSVGLESLFRSWLRCLLRPLGKAGDGDKPTAGHRHLSCWQAGRPSASQEHSDCSPSALVGMGWGGGVYPCGVH